MAVVSDIWFFISEFNMFINKNSDDKSAQYTISRQKDIAKLFEKDIFKVITTNNIPSNVHIFTSYFVDKIKNFGSDKAYEKSWLVIQTYNG